MDVAIVSWSQRPIGTHRAPQPPLILNSHIGRTYHITLVKPGKEQWRWVTDRAGPRDRKGTWKHREKRVRMLTEPTDRLAIEDLSECTDLQRSTGWHGGSQRCQVDVSALLPSLSLPVSLHNQSWNNWVTRLTTTSVKNANVRTVRLAMEESSPDARHQAPSKPGKTKKQLIPPIISPSLSLSASLCTLSPGSFLPYGAKPKLQTYLNQKLGSWKAGLGENKKNDIQVLLLFLQLEFRSHDMYKGRAKCLQTGGLKTTFH